MTATTETRYLRDILRQPEELGRWLAEARGAFREDLSRAAAILREARDLYIVGIGASWNGGLAAQSFFAAAGRPACLVDASEFLHQKAFRPGSAVLALSRSGKSVEMVRLLDVAADAGARVVAVTNAPDSPLGRGADATVPIGAAFDHGVSVVTYSAIALAGAVVAASAAGTVNFTELAALRKAIERLPDAIAGWRDALRGHGWFAPDAPTYFLARGASLASANEAALLWEEAAKAPARALTAGGFRHGPQEIASPGLRVGLWIDSERRRREDLALARDLRRLGVQVMAIGRNLPADAGDLVFTLPEVPPAWQFVIDVIPVQLAAEHLSHVRGVDCDTFRLCSYVVESEGGLLEGGKGVHLLKEERA
jgi:glutamine---fructose-6-phosphate transaminase (isomerizing)